MWAGEGVIVLTTRLKASLQTYCSAIWFGLICGTAENDVCLQIWNVWIHHKRTKNEKSCFFLPPTPVINQVKMLLHDFVHLRFLQYNIS